MQPWVNATSEIVIRKKTIRNIYWSKISRDCPAGAKRTHLWWVKCAGCEFFYNFVNFLFHFWGFVLSPFVFNRLVLKIVLPRICIVIANVYESSSSSMKTISKCDWNLKLKNFYVCQFVTIGLLFITSCHCVTICYCMPNQILYERMISLDLFLYF